jgi:hypothetical protein
MEFREIDYYRDSDEVVKLIRENLNSDYTMEILKWKHLENPFGPSVSFVAINQNKIVGVVFVMRYIFRNSSGEEIKCIRFFDGCTDTYQRGKGVFKSLMKLGFDYFNNDYDFSFANPNSASLPGCLKVGFEKPLENTYYKIGFLFPFFHSSKGKLKKYSLPKQSEVSLTKQDIFLAGNNLQFISWRYQQDNYFIYEYLEEKRANYIIYRIEKKNKLKVIVLCDFFGDISKLNNALIEVSKNEKIFLIYYLDNQLNRKLKTFFNIKHKKAVIVFKKNMFNIPENLIISLGDLEGRL